jgi:HPt (histidine-containing phosphotransfer) domain-containing protein
MSEQTRPPLPVLDTGHLSRMTGGDSALALEVIEIFQQQAAMWSRLLDPQQGPGQWADAAHTLKGASLGIGALRLAAACERAEKAGRSDAPPSLTGAALLIGDIKDALGETLEAAARAAYDLTSAGRFRASNCSNS